MTVSILCPCALADPDAEPGSEWPAAASAALHATLLRRGRFSRHTRAIDASASSWPHDRWIQREFGLPLDANPDAFEAIELGASGPLGTLLVARPVNLHVGMDHLLLMPPHALSLTRATADALAQTANAHFAGQQAPRIEVLAPGCWLLRGERDWSLRAHCAAAAVGRDMRGFLPSGDDARALATWINELQMLWHTHPVNEEREAGGHLPVNGLWIEGGLCLPGRSALAAVHTDHAGLRALARASGVATVDAAPRAADELRALFGSGDSMVELSMWRRPVLERDAVGWRDAWDQFIELIAAALRAAPRNARLRLIFTGEHDTVTLEWRAKDRLKWWRGIDHGPGPAGTE